MLYTLVHANRPIFDGSEMSFINKELWNYKDEREQNFKVPKTFIFTFLSQKYLKIPLRVVKKKMLRCDSSEDKSADFVTLQKHE